MRVKLLVFLFCIFLASVPLVGKVHADPTPPAPTPTYAYPSPIPTLPVNVPIPAYNCGDSADPAKNKCCYLEPVQPKLVDWGFPFDGVAGWINNALKDRLNPILELQKQTDVKPCVNGSPSIPGDLGNKDCICIEPTTAPLAAISPMCGRVSTATGEQAKCLNCLAGASGKGAGVWTSMGCVYGDATSFIQETLLGWGIGLAGGFSMLCIMYAAFMMQTSRGNPESIKKAQQLLTSCITGLMLIIFSVFILRLIGVNILRIPGFN